MKRTRWNHPKSSKIILHLRVNYFDTSHFYPTISREELNSKISQGYPENPYICKRRQKHGWNGKNENECSQSGLAEWDKFIYMDAVADGAAGGTDLIRLCAKVRKGWAAGRPTRRTSERRRWRNEGAPAINPSIPPSLNHHTTEMNNKNQVPWMDSTGWITDQ